MQAMLEAQCTTLGTDLAAECKALVDMVLPQLIAAVDQQLNENLCTVMGLCTNSTVSKEAIIKAAQDMFVKLLKQTELKNHIKFVRLDYVFTSCFHRFMNKQSTFL